MKHQENPMAIYVVKFTARVEVEVEADSYHSAIQKSRTQLDPKVDWDSTDVRQLWPAKAVKRG